MFSSFSSAGCCRHLGNQWVGDCSLYDCLYPSNTHFKKLGHSCAKLFLKFMHDFFITGIFPWTFWRLHLTMIWPSAQRKSKYKQIKIMPSWTFNNNHKWHFVTFHYSFFVFKCAWFLFRRFLMMFLGLV